MRTKILLTAAAAMVAGLVSSNAQVYSANVVGYANVTMAGAGQLTLVANPFDDGNGNQLTNLLAGLPNKSAVIAWAGSTFAGTITKTNGTWNGNLSLPPGAGFFVKNGVAASPVYTNTFVGSVIANINGSVTNPVPAGLFLFGSPIPYAADATVDTNINLGATLPNKSTFIVWNTAGQTYFGTVTKTNGVWNGTAPIAVGQGFFVNAKSATNWVQTLNP